MSGCILPQNPKPQILNCRDSSCSSAARRGRETRASLARSRVARTAISGICGRDVRRTVWEICEGRLKGLGCGAQGCCSHSSCGGRVYFAVNQDDKPLLLKGLECTLPATARQEGDCSNVSTHCIWGGCFLRCSTVRFLLQFSGF